MVLLSVFQYYLILFGDYMETRKILWKEGDGYITANYEELGDSQLCISSNYNEGIDREFSVNVRTLDNKNIERLLIKQPGLREVFTCIDGEFITFNEGTFNVLKK